jgi:thiamine transport system permease protein
MSGLRSWESNAVIRNSQARLLWLAPLVVGGASLIGIVPLIVFARAQGGHFAIDSYAWHVTSFTIWQATISTLLSVLPAIPLARALARRRFWGRPLLLSFFAVPLGLPAIVAVLAIVSLYGASGLLGGLIPVYGFAGIVLTHVFFNLPLAALMMHRALSTIPFENHRLSAQLGLGEAAIFRHVDWPVLRTAMPGIAALVFLLCAASFVTVLTLGGPAATTLEVAIFQSLRMDFDVARAISLSVVQVVFSTALVLLLGRLATSDIAMPPLRMSVDRFDGKALWTKFWDGAVLLAAVLLLLPPLVSLLMEGVRHFAPSLLMVQALLTSLAIAVVSATATIIMAWALARLQRMGGTVARVATSAAFAGLILPPAVMATGWFLALQGIAGGLWLSIALIVSLNILMALPFATSSLSQGFAALGETHEKLCQSLGFTSFTRLRVIDLPVLKPVISQGLLLAFVLSFGDLTAVTLLGAQGIMTLPSLVAQQMGHFQSQQASGTALLLAALCLGAATAAQRLGQRQ